MSKLAGKLKAVTEPPKPKTRPGPDPTCWPLYGAGDLEDWAEVQRLYKEGREWLAVQAIVDEKLGITTPISKNKFRYHWLRKCSCWPIDLRR